MAFIQSPTAVAEPAPGRVDRPKRGFFARLLDAVAASRQRQAEREIARFIELNGGRLTDDLEFRIEQRLLRGRDPGREL